MWLEMFHSRVTELWMVNAWVRIRRLIESTDLNLYLLLPSPLRFEWCPLRRECPCECVYEWGAWVHAEKEQDIHFGLRVLVWFSVSWLPLKCQETKYRVGKVILVLGQSKNFGRLRLGNKMIGLRSCWIWFVVGNWPTSPVSVIQSKLSCSYRLLWTQTWWSMNEVLF